MQVQNVVRNPDKAVDDAPGILQQLDAGMRVTTEEALDIAGTLRIAAAHLNMVADRVLEQLQGQGVRVASEEAIGPVPDSSLN